MPQFKLTMSGNYKPKIEGTDEGIWRRVVLVPWEVTIEKPDKLLIEKLRPEEVIQATAEFRTDSDPIGRFLGACTKSVSGARSQGSELHKVFLAWAKASGERESTATYFGRALSERGIPWKHSNVNWWLDIELTKSVNDFVHHEGNPLRLSDKSAATATTTEDEFIG